MLDSLVESDKPVPNDFLNQDLRIPEQSGSDPVVLEVEADNLLEAWDRASALFLHHRDHVADKLIVCEWFHFRQRTTMLRQLLEQGRRSARTAPTPDSMHRIASPRGAIQNHVPLQVTFHPLLVRSSSKQW